MSFTPGQPINSGAALDELEQADDRAHTNGRYRQMERAARERRPDPSMMVAECRAKMEMYRHTASVMRKVIRWFRHAPHDSMCDTPYGPISLSTAQNEFAHARRLNSRVARQLGDWMRMAGNARPASILHAAE